MASGGSFEQFLASSHGLVEREKLKVTIAVLVTIPTGMDGHQLEAASIVRKMSDDGLVWTANDGAELPWPKLAERSMG